MTEAVSRLIQSRQEATPCCPSSSRQETMLRISGMALSSASGLPWEPGCSPSYSSQSDETCPTTASRLWSRCCGSLMSGPAPAPLLTAWRAKHRPAKSWHDTGYRVRHVAPGGDEVTLIGLTACLLRLGSMRSRPLAWSVGPILWMRNVGMADCFRMAVISHSARSVCSP